jgi:hypothetical protein
MNAVFQAVNDRQKGAFPVSIATSLAVEAAGGVYPERPESPEPILQVQELWFNLRTLHRNLMGALPTDVRKKVLPGHLVPALIEELAILEAAVIKLSHGGCRAVFYHSAYSKLKNRFSHALLRQPSTELQRIEQSLESQTVKYVIEQSPAQDVREFEQEIRGRHPTSFIVTHLPVDLLSRYAFSKLLLLESHTGRIKAPPQWNSKLTGGKDLANIPFNAFTLQVFGDNAHQFNAQPLRLRRQVQHLAQRDRWDVLTTLEKIEVSVKHVTDLKDRAALLALL